MKIARITVDATALPDRHAEIGTLIEAALSGLNCDMELSVEEPRARAATRQRLSLPDDQRVYLSLARFIEDSPLLGEQMFALDAHRGLARVDLVDPASNAVLRSRSYPYGNVADATIESEIIRLQSCISTDFAPAASS